MNAIVFDTETTGKPKDYKGQMSDVNNWPRITQLAYQKIDLLNGEVLHEHQSLIIPDGWTIPTVEEQIAAGEKNPNFFVDNNMSTERCFEEGSPIGRELSLLLDQMNDSNYLCAHNINFDVNVLGAEMIRLDMSAERRLKRICTMTSTMYYCKLPGGFKGQPKWPQLQEVHEIFFGEKFEAAHDAMADVKACSRVLIEGIKRGIIKL